jgi:hypothetical protein
MISAETSQIKGGSAAAAWAQRAGDLARWAWERLVNRCDVWGGYVDEADREKIVTFADGTTGALGKTLTRPAVRQRGKVFLTREIIARHFRAAAPRDVIGLHTTSPENTSRWGGPEVDWHGPESTSPAVNLAAAMAWHERLTARGFHPVLTDSNGAGGYHGPLVLLAEPVPTPRMYAFLKSLIANHAQHGMAAEPELFPKQPLIESGRYGNWLRLPGRHHTRPHWSRVWDGRRWLDGNEAIDFILSLHGDSPALILEAEAPPCADSQARRAFRPISCPHTGNLARRIAGRLARLPNLAEGQGRDDVAFNFAAWLVRDLALANDIALDWLERWDAGNRPPKGRERLAVILGNARQYGRNAVGSGLPVEPVTDQYVRPTRRPGHLVITFTTEVF